MSAITLPAGSADCPQIVELGIDAVACEPALARDRRRLVDEGAFDQIANVGQLVELGTQAREERRLHVAQDLLHARDRCQRQPQRHELTRAGRRECRSCEETFEVVDGLHRLAELPALRRAECQFLDRVQTIANALQRAERPQQPGAQQTTAHRRDRAVDFFQQ
jgi:hypothetical protein